MIKAVFIGSKNDFDEILVHWLSQRTNLLGVVWTKSTAWQDSWRGRLKFAWRRLRRRGLAKMIDETLFFFYYHRFIKKRDLADLDSNVVRPYWAQHAVQRWSGDSIFATNVNAPEVRSFLAERQPDIALAMCINNYFGKGLRAIPKFGVYLWHEGITPEYRGLYSPFWAVHNVDFDRLGYTFLRMNDQVDAGEVFAQGQAIDIDPYIHHHAYIGHKAIFDSLPAIERFLIELEAGKVEPVSREHAKPNYYTYPGISDLVRQKIRLRRLARSARHVEVGE